MDGREPQLGGRPQPVDPGSGNAPGLGDDAQIDHFVHMLHHGSPSQQQRAAALLSSSWNIRALEAFLTWYNETHPGQPYYHAHREAMLRLGGLGREGLAVFLPMFQDALSSEMVNSDAILGATEGVKYDPSLWEVFMPDLYAHAIQRTRVVNASISLFNSLALMAIHSPEATAWFWPRLVECAAGLEGGDDWHSFRQRGMATAFQTFHAADNEHSQEALEWLIKFLTTGAETTHLHTASLVAAIAAEHDAVYARTADRLTDLLVDILRRRQRGAGNLIMVIIYRRGIPAYKALIEARPDFRQRLSDLASTLDEETASAIHRLLAGE